MIQNPARRKAYIKSIYKYVHGYTVNGSMQVYYRVRVGSRHCDGIKNERQAAILADKFLIEAGREPVNILKRA